MAARAIVKYGPKDTRAPFNLTNLTTKRIPLFTQEGHPLGNQLSPLCKGELEGVVYRHEIKLVRQPLILKSVRNTY